MTQLTISTSSSDSEIDENAKTPRQTLTWRHWLCCMISQ